MMSMSQSMVLYQQTDGMARSALPRTAQFTRDNEIEFEDVVQRLRELEVDVSEDDDQVDLVLGWFVILDASEASQVLLGHLRRYYNEGNRRARLVVLCSAAQCRKLDRRILSGLYDARRM